MNQTRQQRIVWLKDKIAGIGAQVAKWNAELAQLEQIEAERREASAPYAGETDDDIKAEIEANVARMKAQAGQ